MNIITLTPLLIGIFLNACAQLLLKAGMDKIGYFEFSTKNILPVASQAAFNPYIVLGLGCYVISVAAWLMGLSRVEVSVAYPLLSLAYIFTAVAAFLLFHENLTLTRLLGILIILLGVFLITRK